MVIKKRIDKAILVGSGFSSKQILDYPYKEEGWTIVAINHGWMACKDIFDYLVYSNDFSGDLPNYKPGQIGLKNYQPALKQFGGIRECGYSIALNTAYWTLATLRPKVICFLGADMNYTPKEDGSTSIYGIGLDIKKNGIPDPFRMAKQHGKGKQQDEYIKELYLRFNKIAEENNCKVFNLSEDPDSLLPYKKSKPELFNDRIIEC